MRSRASHFKVNDGKLVKGFRYTACDNPTILVLGTLPGAESIGEKQYYADRSNAFWYVMGKLFGAGWDLSYKERIAELARHQIAIWDVLRSARRQGSSDTKIQRGSDIANDFESFLRDHPSITTIVFNGRTAQRYFEKMVSGDLGSSAGKFATKKLCSTSAANTRLTKDGKADEWHWIETLVETE